MEDELYGASDSDLRVRLHEVPDTVEALLVIGHNPGLQDLALGMAGDGDEQALARLGDKFATCALATLDIPTSWAALGPGHAYLKSLVCAPGSPRLRRRAARRPRPRRSRDTTRLGQSSHRRIDLDRHPMWVMTRALRDQLGFSLC